MGFKYLKDKNSIFENWLNPVLSGNFNQGANIQAPGTFNPLAPTIESPSNFQSLQKQPCNDMIEKPFWLTNDDSTIVRQGDVLSIGSYFINGVPLSTWSAQFGSMQAYQQKQTMANWYYIDALTKHMFPNGIKAYLDRDQVTEYVLSKLTILRMAPNSNAIGLNVYVKFNLNEEEIWGKFENIGIDPRPKFISSELLTLPIETQIKVSGKVWNIMLDWFKVRTGVYKCVAKELLVFSELGQLKRLSEGNVVEIISSDENKVKLKFDDVTYFIKKPTYYWTNWYFEKK